MKKHTIDKPGARTKRRSVERWKTLLIPVAIGLPVIAVLVWLLLHVTPEPLTAEEILAKEEWSREELIDTLARAFAPQSNRGSRREVLDHLRRQLRKYPEDEQKAIRIRALTGAMGETLRQIRAMPDDERDKMFAAIREQAEKWHREAMTGKGREMLNTIRNSAEGQAFNVEATRIIHSELTPEERRKFAPITEIWIKTLEL